MTGGCVLVLILTCAPWIHAFEYLYRERGENFYRTNSGAVISSMIPKDVKGLVLIHQESEGWIKYYQAPDGLILIEAKVGLPSLSAALSEGKLITGKKSGPLPSTPDFDWWYGCAPTSAGMMMGFYDIVGYKGALYDLVPGGTAELSTFGNPLAIANNTIASPQHIRDYWVGYASSGNDPNPYGHANNCLADFMETNKDSAGNIDGGTTLYWFNNGRPFTYQDAINYGVAGTSGMYGVGEWVTHCGYGYEKLFNQGIDTFYPPYGITFADFKAEIDAGRPMLLHVKGHTMLAYGYMNPSTMYLRDTWEPGLHMMTWGGIYAAMGHLAMTAFIPTGGDPLTPFECPIGSIDEGEPCGEDTNGGCDMASPQFTEASLNQTYCGLTWADNGVSDTDWYRLVITRPIKVTLTAQGNFPLVVGFAPTESDTGNCGDLLGTLDPQASADAYTPATVVATIGPGTYFLFVAPQVSTGYPCTGLWRYFLSIEGTVGNGSYFIIPGKNGKSVVIYLD